MKDELKIGGVTLKSRLMIGTGKFHRNSLIHNVVKSSMAEVITVAMRRVDLDSIEENIINSIPENMILLPNTSGARTAEEAVRIAKLSRATGLGNWVKIEVIPDQKYLLPDNYETVKATEALTKEGFIVLPYMSPDLVVAKQLEEAGAAAVMPLGSPIGSNRGFRTKELVRIMIEESNVPIIVDAGIGKPSEACEAMELGADAVLVNTAIATSSNPVQMAEAFANSVKAGRSAYLSGLADTALEARASSPLTGFLG
ncbi:thiazole biosynthesis protein ThiG [Halalkalibacter wakoensis JCM 9140]|uniref:Thiazole synthase n=1 Tax=Halalkalibacter wakoensis JCM 9140 TaxID=1236970 RepID=W4Q0T3_9BACI|nr:thiazole synthase [Halalkalibacter wakoensis]GAE25587.1 thiazole biosynthesis protein ThiG [Halalkalibacter wakoensis JCM 9140]